MQQSGDQGNRNKDKTNDLFKVLLWLFVALDTHPSLHCSVICGGSSTPKEKQAEKQKGPPGIAHGSIQLNYLLKPRHSMDFFSVHYVFNQSSNSLRLIP